MADHRNFHDRDGWIWFDGELVPWREANVHVLTHALHYASSVFEGQRAYGGEIFKLTEHSERLQAAAPSCSASRFRGASTRSTRPAARCWRANKLEDAYMRPLAWRGSEQMGVSAAAHRRSISPSPPGPGAPISATRRSRKGLRLDISPWRRPAPYTAPTESKASGLYMICTLSRHAGAGQGL